MALTISGNGGLPRPPIDLQAARGPSPDAAEPTGLGGMDFGQALTDAIGALGELSGRADASALQLAAGAPVDVHEVMLNVENASLGFQTALQVRNKLVDAYQEIMRMSL